MRMVAMGALAAAGCGALSGIDDLEKVAAAPDAAVEAATPVVDAGVDVADTGPPACNALYCNDFETEDALATSRVVTFFGSPPAIDDREHHDGLRSVRLSASGSDVEASIQPVVAAIPVDGRITFSFWWKRAATDSRIVARFVGKDESVQVEEAGELMLVHRRADTTLASKGAGRPGAVGIFSRVDLILAKTGADAPGRVKATAELALDGLTSITLDLDVVDTIETISVGVRGSPVPPPPVVWIDDVTVSKE